MTTGQTPPQSRRRGPSPAKTAATRKALLKAALESFLERGFAETRMSDVAARAGVAKGTTYLHFADKAALFGEVLRSVMSDARAGRSAPRPLPDERTGDFLRRVIPPILKDLQTSGMIAVPRLVVTEGARFPELASVYRQIAIEPVLRLVRLYARRAERLGEMQSDSLSRLPILLAAPVVVATLWNGLFVDDEQLDAAAVFAAWLDLVFERNEGAARFSGQPQ
jgi:AcrR family transcriptional regulator